ncbi:MAG: hypothetical protein H6Q56_486 [Deltaproteobacteria bacterium]|nr:hypothetical protein [Deltaproteobacteria bacterium]
MVKTALPAIEAETVGAVVSDADGNHSKLSTLPQAVMISDAARIRIALAIFITVFLAMLFKTMVRVAYIDKFAASSETLTGRTRNHGRAVSSSGLHFPYVHFTSMEIGFGLVSSRFGRVMVRIPLSQVACTLS